MSTTTASILIGHAHQNDGGIIPSHLILFTENSRPALILKALNGNSPEIIVIPSSANTIDDIYLMIAVYILKTIKPPHELYTSDRKELNEIFTKEEIESLYLKAEQAFKNINLKVVFNLFDNCSLTAIAQRIHEYSTDFEITITTMKREYDAWSNGYRTTGLEE